MNIIIKINISEKTDPSQSKHIPSKHESNTNLSLYIYYT